MNGYVRNKSISWTHAMKRAIGPGERVSLDALYSQYGEKHDLAEGEEFVNWLRTVKLRNEDLWEVVFEGEEPKGIEEEEIKEKEDVVVERDTHEEENVTAPIKDMTVSDVVNLSVRKGREVLPKIMDLNLLKYAMQEANQLANKDSLCRMIRKRIQELQIAR